MNVELRRKFIVATVDRFKINIFTIKVKRHYTLKNLIHFFTVILCAEERKVKIIFSLTGKIVPHFQPSLRHKSNTWNACLMPPLSAMFSPRVCWPFSCEEKEKQVKDELLQQLDSRTRKYIVKFINTGFISELTVSLPEHWDWFLVFKAADFASIAIKCLKAMDKEESIDYQT